MPGKKKKRIKQVSVQKDITDRKDAENELRRQNRFLKDVFEAIVHPFYVINPSDYSIVMANSATGPFKSQKTCTCYALTHGRNKPCEGTNNLCPIEEMRKTKTPMTVEHVNYGNDGIPRVLEIHAYPILDGHGDLHRVIEYSFDITRRKRTEDQLRRLSRKIIAVQEMERKRIATELHDGVVQTLSSIKFRMGGLKENSFGLKKRKEIIEKVEEYLEETITELRRISKDLRPDILDEMGLVAAIENFCKEFEERTGIVCKIECDSVSERLSEETELVLYRIVQESLANVEKHSGAKTVKLSFSRSDPGIIVRIQDDGKGFDLKEVENGQGMERRWGLINMRERAGYLGGKLDIKTAPMKGTEIVAKVLLNALGKE